MGVYLYTCFSVFVCRSFCSYVPTSVHLSVSMCVFCFSGYFGKFMRCSNRFCLCLCMFMYVGRDVVFCLVCMNVYVHSCGQVFDCCQLTLSHGLFSWVFFQIPYFYHVTSCHQPISNSTSHFTKRQEEESILVKLRRVSFVGPERGRVSQIVRTFETLN